MAYSINRTDGTLIVTVADGGINASATTIKLLGRNLTNYGEVLNENLVQMLENFASINLPANPLRGQLWYSTQTSTDPYPQGLYVWDGSNWVAVSNGSGGGGGSPDYVLKAGDTMTGQLIIDVASSGYPAGLRSTKGIQIYSQGGNERFIDFSSSNGSGFGRRWSITVDNISELGGNTGSNFSINRWNDSDTVIDAVLTINRASGVIAITQNLNMSNKLINNVLDPVNQQDAATKKYVDDEIIEVKQYVDDEIATALGGGSGGPSAIVGEIRMWSTSTPPAGWLICNGAAISRTTYSSLFTVIGTTFGAGNGTTTFNIPNGMGRSPLGAGLGAGLTNRVLGDSSGSETHTLTLAEMPVHNHSGSGSTTDSAGAHTHTVTDDYVGPSSVFNLPDGVTNPHALLTTTKTTSSAGAHTHTISSLTIGNSGSGQAHNNMHPFFTVNYIIYAGV